MFEIENIKTILFVVSGIIIFYMLLRSISENKSNRKYLISSLLITIILLLSLSIKIHHFLRDNFGIQNTFTYLILMIPFVLHFIKYRLLILNYNFVLLVFSAICLLIALITDLFTDAKIIQFESSDTIEEILRIMGAAFWFSYYLLYLFKYRKSYEPYKRIFLE